MTDEKKPCGGVTPELNDEALDAVTGGMMAPGDPQGRGPDSTMRADQAWEWLKKMCDADEDKEQQT